MIDHTIGGASMLNPIHLQAPPEGILTDLNLTFDDFLISHPHISVKRVRSQASKTETCSIADAAKQMRSTEKKRKSYFYSFSLANEPELDQAFEIPSDVEKIDLLSQFWPSKKFTNYVKTRSKLFYCYTSGHKSLPHKTYGGMSEWLYLLSGKLDLELIQPTNLNLSRLSSCQSSEIFEPQQDTSTFLTLAPGEFLIIPFGWITIRKAYLDSYALAGEFCHLKEIGSQMLLFHNDTLDSMGKYTIERDKDIRLLYWIAVFRIFEEQGKTVLLCQSPQSLRDCRDTLSNWKNAHKNSFLPHIYAPSGIEIALLVRDLATWVSHRLTSRKPSNEGDTNSLTPDSSKRASSEF